MVLLSCDKSSDHAARSSWRAQNAKPFVAQLSGDTRLFLSQRKAMVIEQQQSTLARHPAAFNIPHS